MRQNYTYYRQVILGHPLPLAYVDLDLLDQNIKDIVRRAGDKQIRVASKSVRSVAILRRILAASPHMQGIMCFTVPEAIYLSQQGFDDLLLGYPCWQAEQVKMIAAEIKAGKTIVLMIDSVAHVEHLNAIAAAEDVILPVCLDMDMSVDFPGLHFGVWRSGVTNVDAALHVHQSIEEASHIKLDGVMGYEAQIAGVADTGQGIKSQVIRFLKSRSLKPIAERRAAIVTALQNQGATLRIVNGGGTGSLESTRQESLVTEVTVGSGFYASALFDNYQHFKHLPAAGFAIEIVRQPLDGILTCLGGGYIASGAVGKDKQPKPYLPENVTLTDLEGAGEVQTPFLYNIGGLDGGQPLQLGDPIFMRHSKAGELCERFNTLLLIQDGGVVDEVKTYRGDGYAFL